jgi:hypothetical protein
MANPLGPDPVPRPDLAPKPPVPAPKPVSEDQDKQDDLFFLALKAENLKQPKTGPLSGLITRPSNPKLNLSRQANDTLRTNGIHNLGKLPGVGTNSGYTVRIGGAPNPVAILTKPGKTPGTPDEIYLVTPVPHSKAALAAAVLLINQAAGSAGFSKVTLQFNPSATADQKFTVGSTEPPGLKQVLETSATIKKLSKCLEIAYDDVLLGSNSGRAAANGGIEIVDANRNLTAVLPSDLKGDKAVQIDSKAVQGQRESGAEAAKRAIKNLGFEQNEQGKIPVFTTQVDPKQERRRFAAVFFANLASAEHFPISSQEIRAVSESSINWLLHGGKENLEENQQIWNEIETQWFALDHEFGGSEKNPLTEILGSIQQGLHSNGIVPLPGGDPLNRSENGVDEKMPVPVSAQTMGTTLDWNNPEAAAVKIAKQIGKLEFTDDGKRELNPVFTKKVEVLGDVLKRHEIRVAAYLAIEQVPTSGLSEVIRLAAVSVLKKAADGESAENILSYFNGAKNLQDSKGAELTPEEHVAVWNVVCSAWEDTDPAYPGAVDNHVLNPLSGPLFRTWQFYNPPKDEEQEAPAEEEPAVDAV